VKAVKVVASRLAGPKIQLVRSRADQTRYPERVHYGSYNGPMAS
jgi:hypothetical protein